MTIKSEVTIEPGTVIEFEDDAGLGVYGSGWWLWYPRRKRSYLNFK